jgi:hypothetical protein
MNLFILSMCVKECAEYMFDKHIYKIILEAVQMLCTAKQLLEPEYENNIKLYKMCHKNHPVTIWIRTSLDNYMWTISLVESMHEEWKYRYNHPTEKMHSSFLVAMYLKEHAPPVSAFPQSGLTKFALAMPDKYKVEDPIQSYRNYYRGEEKRRLASWKKRGFPPWWFNYNIKIYVRIKKRLLIEYANKNNKLK